MKNTTALILSLFIGLSFFAQEMSGVITFERRQDWVSIGNKMPWRNKEDAARMNLNTAGWKREAEKYQLFFKGNATLYKEKPAESLNNTNYTRKKQKLVLQRDYQNNTAIDWIETLGKKYLIKDDIPKVKWKILNEIKEVNGYVCMKAETFDTVKNQKIIAWYTDKIMVNGGPEGFGGLPGLILEININAGDLIVSASKINLEMEIDKLPQPKKMKGKEIDYENFWKLIGSYITESMDGEKNPYWRIRY